MLPDISQVQQKLVHLLKEAGFLLGCGSEEYSTEYENWFGYYSRYKGQTNHAYYNGYTDAEAMAKKVVDGINTAKKLYRTS